MNKKNKKKIQTKTWRIISYCSMSLFFIALVFFAWQIFKNIDKGIDFTNYQKYYNLNREKERERNICVDCPRRNLDGVFVEEGKENLFPIAIVFDNHPDARPSHSLSKAGLVYEAEAEAGIIRYLAIYSSDENYEVGPIRSARPYFLDWAEGLSALFVHSGGSPEALARIAKEEMHDFNEFYNGKYFWRSDKLAGPHDLLSSIDNIREYLEKKNLIEGKFFAWEYKEDKLEQDRQEDIKDISIGYKNTYDVSWKYDYINNIYLRKLSGEDHIDKDGDQIVAKNIIIQSVDREVLDNELRVGMDTIGEGKAIVCLDGQCLDASWVKKNKYSRTKYYYEDVGEVKFNAGTTWIEIVNDNIEVSY